MIAVLQTKGMSPVDVNVVFRPLQGVISASSNKRSDRNILSTGDDLVAFYRERSM